MKKEIILIRTVIDHHPDGTYRHGTVQYKMKINGVTENRIFTLTIDNVISKVGIADELQRIKRLVEQAEGIGKT